MRAFEMATEFELIFDDFSTELDALLEMAGAPSSVTSSFTPKARVAAGNGATLLLAALFEEFIRQQIKAAYVEKARNASNISAFPTKITSTVWRRSLEMLARKPFDDVISSASEIGTQITAILAFCLRNEIRQEMANTLAHNDTNMRPAQMNALFNTIGFANIAVKACEDVDLIGFLGSGTAGKANADFAAKLEDFFRRRNDIAHAVQLGTSSGPNELANDIGLFRAFGRALAAAIQAEL